ncbi:MAG: hypothetical protein QM737_12270 [Ferruginibacter sp.]
MKTFILFFASIFFLLQANAQSVGINTNNPDPSAVLDIHGFDKGILLPKVYLLSVNDNTTITAPATGLLLYNYDAALPAGVGFYYNSGTATAPVWTNLKTEKFSLPFKDTITSIADAFSIRNAGTGNALFVDGKIKIQNTFEPNGKFLMTSWPDGNVKWEGGHNFCVKDAGNTNFPVSPNTDTKVPFYMELYDMGNNFLTADALINNSTFIVPSGGIYHFDATIMWAEFTGSTNNVYAAINIFVNGNLYLSSRQSVGSSYFSNSISTDILLNTGAKVYITAYHNSSEVQHIMQDGLSNRFSGRFVSTF